MTTQQAPPTSPVVHLPAEKNLDRQIDICRRGARKDNMTVIIERTVPRRDGSTRRIPIIEITPSGDIREIDAPPLRVTIMDHLLEANASRYYGVTTGMNIAARKGHEAIAELVKVSADYLAAAREARQARKPKASSRKAATR